MRTKDQKGILKDENVKYLYFLFFSLCLCNILVCLGFVVQLILREQSAIL